MTPTIAPEEATIAVLGIDAFLRGELKLTAAAQNRANGLAQEIDREMLRAVQGEREPASPAPFNYSTVGKLLQATGDDDKRRTLLRAFHAAFIDAPPELTSAVEAAASRMMDYLRQRYPSRTRVTVTGQTPIDPTGVERARFERLWQIAEDPLAVLGAMGRGALSRDQVQAVSDLYPTIYAVMRRSLLRTIGKVRARRRSWQPTRKQDLQLRVFMQADAITPQLAAEIASMPPPNTAPPHGHVNFSKSGDLQTQGQRIATPAQR